MANAADSLRLILAAVKAGRLTPDSARGWARRAASGESIQVIATMAAMSSREHLGPRALGALQSELVSILAGSGGPADSDLADYAALFTADPVQAREDEIRAAARRVGQMTDDEIFAVLFGTET